jgi:hypothetical protein
MAGGYAPAPEVAKRLRKSLSSVHRLAHDQMLRTARDGSALYIEIDALEKYYANCPPFLRAISELKQWLSEQLAGKTEKTEK